MPRRTGVTLALTVIRSTRTWKNEAGGSPAGWDPVVAQTCHGLHVGLPGLESFPVRSAARNVAGPDASKAHVTRRNSDAAPIAMALERYVPLCRFGQERDASSHGTSTEGPLVVIVSTRSPATRLWCAGGR